MLGMLRPSSPHIDRLAARSGVFAVAAVIALFLSSCGGGGTAIITPPPPPPPPAPGFSVSAQTASIPLEQQGPGQSQFILVTPANGFTGDVNVSFQTLPAGLSITPAGPYSIAAGGSQGVTISASPSAALGNNTLSLTGASGTLSSSTNFTVAVSAPAFQLTASPPSISMTPGTTVNLQLTISTGSEPLPSLLVDLPTQLPNTGLTATVSSTNPQPNVRTITVQASPFAQPLVSFPLTIAVAQVTNQNNATILTVPITVVNTAPSTSSPTRSTIIRADMDPTGGVYDQARKLLFVTVRQLNQVLVYSTVDNSLRATISVDQPQGIDESLDGKKVYVGTLTPNLAVIDPDLLQVIQTVPGPPLSNPNFPGETLFPFTLAALSNGKVLVEATDGESISIAGGIFLWDPTSGVFSSVTTPGPSGDLIISRSADRSKVLVGSQDEPSALALYDVATNSVTVSGNIEQGGAAPGVAAVSPNGSQIAFPSGSNVVLYDASFNQTASIPLNFGTTGSPQITYSLDGKFVYVLSNAEGLVGFAVLDATNFTVLGAAPTGMTQLFAVDETGVIFGGADRVIEFADASSPSDVRLPFPSLFQFTPTLLNPTAPTSAALSGLNFSSTDTYQVFFGPPPASPNTKPAANLSVSSSTQLQMTAPQDNALGVANATITRPDGWNAVLPDAVSYGPQILRLTTNAGPASGGTQLAIYGYGFLSPSTTVTIGGNPATVTQVFGPGFISPFPFPMDRITLTTPSGASGPADVTVSTPSGSTTLSGGFQYLAQAQIFPVAGALNQILYDQSRQELFISNTDHNRIEVFSLASMSFLTPIPAGALPLGIALTPDASKLAVVNSGGSTVWVINPDTQATVAVYPVITQSDSASLCQGVPFSITPAGSHGMFVAVDCTALAANGTLHFLDLNTGSLNCAGIPFCDSSGLNITVPGTSGLYIIASSPDGTKVVAGDAGSSPSLVASFDLTADTVTTFPLPFNQEIASDAALNADANRVAVNFGIYTTQLGTISFPQDIDYLDAGTNSVDLAVGEKLNPSGSLLFAPQFLDDPFPSSVDVYDVYRGRILMRIAPPDSIRGTLNSMTLDETGSKLFLITTKGISILQIAQLPLSIATVTNATASVGDQVTIRGSGFKTGATVTFGTAIASATVLDANTITATVPSLSSGTYRITVKNSDGTQYSIDAAFSVN